MQQWKPFVSALFGFAGFAFSAMGADIRFSKPEEMFRTGFANIIIEGKIEAGDHDKLLKLIEQEANDYARISGGIFLASSGGNLMEAIRIGRLVRKLRLDTHVSSDVPAEYENRRVGKQPLSDPKANRICASACFFIFVAGVDRERDIYPPLLGIHRPYFSETDLKQLSGNDALSSASQIRKLVDEYLKEMGVPAKYSDLMFSIPKDQVRMIGDDDFKRDFEGYIPELRDWLDAQCNNLTDVEKVVSNKIERKKALREKLSQDEERINRILAEKNGQEGECQYKVLNQLRWEAWEQFQNH